MCTSATSCYKSVHKLSTSCVRTACSQLLEQAVNNLDRTSLMALSDLLQGCSNKSDADMININVTRLTTQGYNNTAIS